MRRYLLLVLIFWKTTMLAAQPQSALQELLGTKGLEHAIVGISIKQVTDGKELVGHNARISMTPASVAKLLPTWFSLQEKGADYRYQTKVCYTGTICNGTLAGNIVIESGGDPTCNSRYFPRHDLLADIVEKLQEQGVREINGQIIVEGAKAGTAIPGSWVWEDISNYYGALYLPFNYRDNTYTLNFQTGATGSPTKLLSVTPELPGIKFQNETIAQGNKEDAWIYGGPYSSVLSIQGTLPINRSSVKIKGAMHYPAAAFMQELKKMLVQNGIRINNENCADTNRMEFLCHHSPSLKEIVFHTNKVSVNLFAEALGSLIETGGNSWSEKVSSLLSEIGIDSQGIVLEDACGLSPKDVLPPQVLTDLLVYIAKQGNADFVSSLPEAGKDGGLLGYCYSSPELKNKMKAKTGSMSGVRALAGYLTAADGTQLAFTIIVNHYTCTVSQLQKAIGKFLSFFI